VEDIGAEIGRDVGRDVIACKKDGFVGKIEAHLSGCVAGRGMTSKVLSPRVVFSRGTRGCPPGRGLWLSGRRP